MEEGEQIDTYVEGAQQVVTGTIRSPEPLEEGEAEE